MNRATWMPRWGDVNGLFGMLLDNLAALVLLYTLLAAPDFRDNRFTPAFVLTWVVPGTVTGVLLGAVLYAWMARRLAQRSGRADVTAMPVGLDTPSVIGVSLFVLVPALADGRAVLADRNLEPLELQHLASVFAWQVGAVVLVMVGLFKLVVAPLGALVRSWLPRAALLGSLAAIALALIAFIPLSRHVATAPVVGLPVLTIILVTLLARRGAQNAIPGTVLALAVGFLIVLASALLAPRGWSFVPLPGASLLNPGEVQPLAGEVWGQVWWNEVLRSAVGKLPLALPFALFTVVGGMQCAESAAAAGDDYDPRGVLLVQGAATTVAGLLGGVVQTTPYFGHPAYKKMGAGWAYVVLAAAVLALAGYFGWFTRSLEWVPGAVLFPVVIYIGLRTIAHSYESTPPRDYAAMALAAVPVLAYLIVVAIEEMLGDAARPKPEGVVGPTGYVLLQALRCLGNGFILTSLLWATALTALLDGKPRRAAVAMLIAAVCSLFGLIHSPLRGAPLAMPHEVWQQLATERSNLRLQYQSPFHWAAAYVLAAVVLLIDSLLPARAAKAEAATTTPRDSELVAAAAPTTAEAAPPG
jgi:AGZA family xanthine/uracil permease-like MFS transporter